MKGEWIRKPVVSAAVIFIHGILSDGDTCWLHDNGTYWPELLAADPALAKAGIYIFSYETGIFSGSYSLNDVVDSLKEHLILDGVTDQKQLVFVCHSMGGIVARKFLVERCADFIGKRTELGLFLVASPSLGSSYANFLSPLAKLFGHSQGDVLRFEQNNTWLNGLDKEFMNLKDSGRLKLTGKELVEDKFVTFRSFFRRQVVEPFSGARYFGESYKVPDSDHFSIAKPDSDKAIQHRLLGRFLKDLFGLPDRAAMSAEEGPRVITAANPLVENFYVNRPVPPTSKFYIERTIDQDLSALISEGSGIASIWGPRCVGKTSMLLNMKAKAESKGLKVAWIHCESLRSDNMDVLLLDICRVISFRETYGTEEKNARNLFKKLLSENVEKMLLIFDEGDFLKKVEGGLFFQILRGLCFDLLFNPGMHVFILMCSYTPPRDFITDKYVSPYNFGRSFYVRNFNFEEFKQLYSNLTTALSPGELALLWDYTGGQPYLANQVGLLLNAGILLPTVLANMEGEAFDFFYHSIYLLFKDNEPLKNNMRKFISDGSIDSWAFRDLVDGGIFIEENNTFKFSCTFYKKVVEKILAE